ncbi:hypothetical protein EPA93_11560 [Ktedonosporobacter rubrisoli]|uniref:Blue (type 1) copper domain-containing protein n=2 Tax=Ktedonosporobacter rubrisoli TaxID=2509675 RepID=A0A4P6K5Z6_KTERU|nr:hypothetical protein EPA93_11560 [Ktedonosporobacter rubrisoli]
MMAKLFSRLALGFLLVTILTACMAAGTSTQTTAGTEVHMDSSRFSQTEITIQKGQSVTLINDDPLTPHVIANGTWENGTAKPGIEPNTPKVKDLQINGSARATLGPFNASGTFRFYCTIHPGMSLTVIVRR